MQTLLQTNLPTVSPPQQRQRSAVRTQPNTKYSSAAVEKGETLGFMKVVVDAETNAILGAAILGISGDAVQGLLDMMYAKAPYTTLQRAVHVHPAVSELIPTVLRELKP